MSNQRDFWIDPSDIDNGRVWTKSFGYRNRIHVREVSPSRDALFDEMLGALKSCVAYMDGAGIKWGEQYKNVIAKAEGKE